MKTQDADRRTATPTPASDGPPGMSSKYGWAVYGGQPVPRHGLSERAARRLARRYTRLGIRSDLYCHEAGQHSLTLHSRTDERGRMRYEAADGGVVNEVKTTGYRHRGCGGAVLAELDGVSCTRCGAELQEDDWTAGEPPRLEDATTEDLHLAVAAIGPLARYGGFLRAVLAGIYAERERTALLSKRQNEGS